MKRSDLTSKQEALLEKISIQILNFQDQITELVRDLSTEELAQLPAVLETVHENSHGFRTTSYDEVTDQIEAELGLRKFIKESDQYFYYNSKAKSYCGQCKQECRGNEHHFAVTQQIEYSPKYLKLNELSRKALIDLLMKEES